MYKYSDHFSTVTSHTTMANKDVLAKLDGFVRGLVSLQVIRRQIFCLASPTEYHEDPLEIASLQRIQMFSGRLGLDLEDCITEIENILDKLMTGVDVVGSACSANVTDDELEGIACVDLNKAKLNFYLQVERIREISDSNLHDYVEILVESRTEFAGMVRRLEWTRPDKSLPPQPKEDAAIDPSTCRNVQAILAKMKPILEEINPLVWSGCKFFRLQMIKYELHVYMMLLERALSKLKNWEKHPQPIVGVNEQVFRVVDIQHFVNAAKRLKEQNDAIFDLLRSCPDEDAMDEMGNACCHFFEAWSDLRKITDNKVK